MRKLFGRKERYYNDKGLVLELNGEILESRTFILPSEQINKVLRIFSKEKIKYRIKTIFMN